MSIQRENSHMKQLENENRELKNALVDHQFTLELIMSKYRKQISQLIKFNQITKEHCSQSGSCCGGHPQLVNRDFMIINAQNEKIRELISVMQRSLQLDDDGYDKIQETLKQLTEENKTLRELLEISKTIGGSTLSISNEKSTAEISTQTGDSKTEEASTQATPVGIAVLSLPPTKTVERKFNKNQLSKPLTPSTFAHRPTATGSPKTPIQNSSKRKSIETEKSPMDVDKMFADHVGTIKKNQPNGAPRIAAANKDSHSKSGSDRVEI